jgi:hypothetical protein
MRESSPRVGVRDWLHNRAHNSPEEARAVVIRMESDCFIGWSLILAREFARL